MAATKPKPFVAVTWEDASKNSFNTSRTVAEIDAHVQTHTFLVTTLGHMTVCDKKHIVLSRQADHPAEDGDEWTYRDHTNIPRGMVRKMRRLA